MSDMGCSGFLTIYGEIDDPEDLADFAEGLYHDESSIDGYEKPDDPSDVIAILEDIVAKKGNLSVTATDRNEPFEGLSFDHLGVGYIHEVGFSETHDFGGGFYMKRPGEETSIDVHVDSQMDTVITTTEILKLGAEAAYQKSEDIKLRKKEASEGVLKIAPEVFAKAKQLLEENAAPAP